MPEIMRSTDRLPLGSVGLREAGKMVDVTAAESRISPVVIIRFEAMREAGMEWVVVRRVVSLSAERTTVRS